MIKTKRLFLALVIPDDTKQAINRWRARHMESLCKKPVPLDNYHVTLVYLGAIETSEVDTLVSLLAQVKSDNFQLTIDKTDYWPEPKAIIIAPSNIPPKLIELQRNINKVVRQAGIPGESRTYRPHITLYRKVIREEFRQLEEDGIALPHVSLAIDHFALFESVSTEQGVQYHKLQEFELTGEFA